MSDTCRIMDNPYIFDLGLLKTTQTADSLLVLNPPLLFTACDLIPGAEESGILKETQFLAKERRWRNL